MRDQRFREGLCLGIHLGGEAIATVWHQCIGEAMDASITGWIREPRTPQEAQAKRRPVRVSPHDARIKHRETKAGLRKIHPAPTRHFESGLLPRGIPMRGPFDLAERNPEGRTPGPNSGGEFRAEQRLVLLPIDE